MKLLFRCYNIVLKEQLKQKRESHQPVSPSSQRFSTSDQHLSADDIALGHKQLLEVERAFRTLKGPLTLRPIYHSKDEPIRSHVLFCWLALLLIRIAEVETKMTWPKIKRIMQRLNLVEFLTKDGHILQHTELTPDQRNILNKLKIKHPKTVIIYFTRGYSRLWLQIRSNQLTFTQ